VLKLIVIIFVVLRDRVFARGRALKLITSMIIFVVYRRC
jgi:hypothetical protein